MPHYCQECHGTGRDAKRTAARPKWESGYIACRLCHGNGLDSAEYFRWGNHPPLYDLTKEVHENHVPVIAAASVKIEGVDNYSKPRQDFADDLASKTNAEFVKAAETCIWLSAYASNNRRSDYHWQADLCAKEAHRRGNPDLYKQAWEQASAC